MRKSFGGFLGCVVVASLFAACGGSPTGGSDDGTDEGLGGSDSSTGGKTSTGGKPSSSTGGKSSGNGEIGGDFTPDLCRNRKLDEDETSIDCGGPCGKCDGAVCTAASECKSRVCAEADGLGGASGVLTCQPSTCGDGIVNPGEKCDSGEGNGIYCKYGVSECRVCNDECQTVPGIEPVCGDGVTQSPEICDGEEGCRSDCSGFYPTCVQLYYVEGETENGGYWVDADGVGGAAPRKVYCDFNAGGYMYESLAMGQYDVAYSGYTALTVSALQGQTMQDFFRWSYNENGGLVNIGGAFTSGNCCFADVNGDFVEFGNYMYPASGGEDQCSPGGGYAESIYQIYVYQEDSEEGGPGPVESFIAEPPLASNFFSTYPVAAGADCSLSSNPGLFAKITYSWW